MNISKGLYEVITSEQLGLEQKLEAIPRFTITPAGITEEDASLICAALKDGRIEQIL